MKTLAKSILATNILISLYIPILKAEILTIDNISSEFSILSGSWHSSTVISGYLGSNYQHDNNVSNLSQVKWQLAISKVATYEVFARWTVHNNRANNATYIIEDINGLHHVTANQRINNGIWVSLGIYDRPTSVVLSNQDANGYVIADAIKTVMVEENLDIDNDGINNDDELNLLSSNPNDAYSLDPTGEQNDGQYDSDSDGFSNLYEIIQGTNPLNSDSVPPISSQQNTINGNLTVGGALLLTPKPSQPFICNQTSAGGMYFNKVTQIAMICDGNQWNEYRGPQGVAGDKGDQGVKGDKGDKGDTGARGIQGIQGEKGDTGEQGPQGIQGIQGEKGEKGDPGIFSGPIGHALITQDFPNGTVGGTHAGKTWIRRQLNNEVYDTSNFVQVNNGQITLTAGTYLIEANQVIYDDVGVPKSFRGRIRNISNNETVAVSLNARLHLASGTSGVINAEIPSTLVTINSAQSFELQYYVQSAHSDSRALGYPMTTGEVERYAYVIIKKLN